MSLAAPTICAASAGRPGAEKPRLRAPHSAGELVDRDHCRGRDEVLEHPREVLHPLVELQIDRAVQMVGRQPRFRCGAFAERQEQVRVRVVGEHHRDRTLDVRQPGVAQRPAHPGGVDDAVVSEQDQGVHAAIGHRRPQPRAGLATHPIEIRCFRDVERRRRCGQERSGRSHRVAYRPRNSVMLPLTIRAAACGADRVDNRGQRLLRIAERAFVVRIVARPHHLVDADLVDQLQPQRVDHERRAHVGVPVVAHVVLKRPIEHVLVRRHQVLGVLQSPRHPGDSALEPADPQTRVIVEDPGEEVLGELSRGIRRC